MGKDSPPAAPDYKGQAIATANSGKYNTTGPAGGTSWEFRGGDPANPQPGDYTQHTTLSAPQQQLYDQNTANQYKTGLAANDMIGGLGDTKATSDALYGKATQYYKQNFGDQQSQLETQLQNQGLQPGSEAYDKAIRNFRQSENDAYGTAANNAIIGADQAQNNAVNRIASLLASSRGQTPTAQPGGPGADLLGAASQQYAQQSANVNASNAQSAQTTSGLASLAMMAAMMMA